MSMSMSMSMSMFTMFTFIGGYRSSQRGSYQALQLMKVYFEVPIHEARRPRFLSPRAPIAERKLHGFSFTFRAMNWILRPLAGGQVEAVVNVGQMTKASGPRKGTDALV